MQENYKEVRFDLYCKKCKHKDVKEVKDPCNECLEEYLRLHTNKPSKYEEKEK